jgi:putative ABC transport system ATP-binding protein
MSADNHIAVSCAKVAKTYGTGSTAVRALRDIELEVHTGELMMLVGPSGSGKTTLISVIAGILDNDAGECMVFGHDFKKMKRNDKIRYRGKNIGFVFQAFNLFPTLTSVENVTVPLLLNGMKKGEATRKAKDILDSVGLGDKLSKLPSELSGGQQQRVAIARAMVHNPRLIVCDEPTSALDHQTGHKVMEMLRRVMVAPDRALIVVTHDARIFEFADQIAEMDDGIIMRVVNSAKEL